MAELTSLYSDLSGRQKIGGAALLVLIIALVGAFGWWALRAPSAVLFSDLAEADAGIIVAELDKLKQPYEIGPDGRSILVPQESVHKTRMALMSHQLPLQGAVGFELFNTADFGASDFVQKVNFQRALQGELTRTILSIEQIQSARVHLAMPEQALFRRDGPKAKASVTVVTKPGFNLQAAQVAGIQRLVGASVPEVKPDDVTVLDQHGVVLSRAMSDDAAGGAAQLDAKLAMEQLLNSKVSQLLGRVFKPGEAVVTVDVVLNHQQSKVTTEEVLTPSTGLTSQQPAGVLVRERSVTRDHGTPDAANTPPSATTTTQEMDYQTGKRVAQVVSQPGEVSRINVAVVVRHSLTEAEVARLTHLVGISVGLQAARGDAIAFYSMVNGEILGSKAGESPLPIAEVATGDVIEKSANAKTDATRSPSKPKAQATEVIWLLAAFIVIALLGLVAYLTLRSGRSKLVSRTVPAKLSAEEREALLRTLRQWIGTADNKA
jgi:flagellar M-ring protein FliF